MPVPGPGGQGGSLGIMRHCFLRGRGGTKHPASFGGRKVDSPISGDIPADAAGANLPDPRPPTKVGAKGIARGESSIYLDKGLENDIKKVKFHSAA